MGRHLRILLLVTLVSYLALAHGQTIEAAGPEDIFKGGQSVSIGDDETIDSDQYLAAQTVVIDGTVLGDVGAFADTVDVNGTIEGDLWAAARSVVVKGAVQGDVRVAADSLLVSGDIGRNTLAGVRSLEVEAGGNMGGDVVVYSSKAIVRGIIRGDISGETAEYVRTGSIGGSELIKVEPGGKKKEEDEGFGDWILGRIRHFVSLLLVGGLMLALLRERALGLGTTAVRRPLASVGSGLLVIALGIGYTIVLLIVLVIVSFVFGTLGLGGVLAAAWVSGILSEALVVLSLVVGGTLIAGALTSLVVGRTAMEGRLEVGRFEVWAWLTLGAAVYAIASGLPYVGVVVQVAVALLTLGAMGLAAWNAWFAGRRSTEPAD